MKKTKKLLSIMLALLMITGVAGSVNIVSLAQNNTTKQNIEFNLVGDWVQDEHGWKYVDRHTSYCFTDGIARIDNEYYGFDVNGYMVTGWYEFNGEWFYFYANGVMAREAWVQDSHGWLFVNNDGCIVKYCELFFDENNQIIYEQMDPGWGTSYMIGPDGYLITGWFYDEDYGWYRYAHENGRIAVSEWVTDSYGWCYLNSFGFLVTDDVAQDSQYYYYMDYDGHIGGAGWHDTFDNGWVYAYSDGTLAVSTWIQDSNGWLYLDYAGRITTNTWTQDSSGWLYLDSNGRITTNTWVEDSQGWCYLDETGHCLTNSWMYDSLGWCYLDGNGRLTVNGWAQDSYGWLFMDSTGHILTNNWAQDSWGYMYMGDDGRAIYNDYLLLDENNKIIPEYNEIGLYENTYYVDINGYMVTGWFIAPNEFYEEWQYAGNDGRLVSSVWVEDAEGMCYINYDGYLLRDDYVTDENGIRHYVDKTGHKEY